MAIEVDFTHWEILRHGSKKELGREYTFTGLAGEGSKTIVEIRLRLDEKNTLASKLTGLFGKSQQQPFIYFVIQPYIFEHNGWAMAQFGLAREGNINHKIFSVKTESIASGGNFIVVDPEHSELCLNVLMQCEPIMLTLMSSKGEKLGSIPLENDLQFVSAYGLLQLPV